MNFNRRDFSKLALAALPATQLLAAKPNSKWGGVQVGINAPYSFQRMSGTADKIIEYMTQVNLSACELRLQPVEAFLGAPGVYASNNDIPAGTPRPAAGRGPVTPEQQEAAKKLEAWRLALSMDKVKQFRKKYEDAGILIQVVKIDNFNSFSDPITDYFFNVAKALGAHALSTEGNMKDIERLGKFADKHKMWVGYHGHTAGPGGEAFGAPENWEKAMAGAKYNGINLDIGHFVAGNNTSPVPFLTKYHEHVTHIHVKDRKMNNGANTPFGQGDTPIVEVLQLIKKNKWNIQATIEFEYPVPQGSDVLTEISKCVEYCRKALE